MLEELLGCGLNELLVILPQPATDCGSRTTVQTDPVGHVSAAVLGLAVAVREGDLLVGELGVPVQHGEGDRSVQVIHVDAGGDHVLDAVQQKVWQGLVILGLMMPPIGWDTLC